MEAETILQMILTLLTILMGSAGLWAWVQSRDNRKNASLKLLLGLAHDRIIHLGMGYIERGWVTKDEYDDFMNYLYVPYSTFGGNGLAQRVKQGVDQLPIRKYTTLEDLKNDSHKSAV